MLTGADHERVSAAIRAAETRTSGEIFCVVSDRPERYPETALAIGIIAAFAVPLLSVWAGFQPWTIIPQWRGDAVPPTHIVESFLVFQLVIFFAVAGLVALTGLARWLTPDRVRRARMHRLATDQFLARGLHDTEGRTGVLIFANVPEHHAEVLADESIYRKVSPDLWGDAVAELVKSARAGDVAGGFVRAVELTGTVLAEHFPPGQLNRNELPDRLVEM